MDLLDSVGREGGEYLLDGRGYVNKENPNGNYAGPTIIKVDTNMTAYKEEIFGPALCVLYADTISEAL